MTAHHDTAERITRLLVAEPYRLHNYGQIVDFAAHLVNVPEHRASHLLDLTPAEHQRVLEQLANTKDGAELKEKWIAERLAQRNELSRAEVIAQGAEWLR